MSRARALTFLFLAMSLVGAAVVGLVAAEKYSFLSGWRTQTIRIDGNDEEWRPILEPVKDQHFAVAFLNDDEALYLCLVSADATAIRQITVMGLTVWLDPAGVEKKKTFGVRYRVRPAARIEVLSRGGKDAKPVNDGTGGFAARVESRPDLLVYELQVPLRKTEATPLAPDLDAGAELRVTLETPEWRGPLPRAGGGRVQVGVGVGGPHGGIFYPGLDTSLLKPITVAGALRLAAAPVPSR